MMSNMIRFHLKWWMNTNHFITEISIHPLEPSVFSLYGHQSLWMGSSYRASETILSWSFDGRPIPAPYQYARNDDHSLCTKKSHNIYSSYLCHDIYGQHNSGLLYQQTRLNSLSQPMYRGLEDSHLCLEHDIVIRIRPIPGKFNILADRLSTLDKPIKIEWALDQMIPIPYSKCSNIQMWICLRLNSITNSHCIYPLPDSHALAVHALSMNWNLLHAFAFPPTILIPSILAKIRQSQCRIVLIAPFWPQRPWFSELL